MAGEGAVVLFMCTFTMPTRCRRLVESSGKPFAVNFTGSNSNRIRKIPRPDTLSACPTGFRNSGYSPTAVPWTRLNEQGSVGKSRE